MRDFITEFTQWGSKESNRYYLIGFFFLFLQFIVILMNFRADNFDVFYWFCNHTPLIFAFAFFMRKKDVIKALVNVGFIAQFLWSLDFIVRIFTGVNIFNMTGYVFESSLGIFVLVPIIIHMFSTNLAFFLTYDHKPSMKTLLYSLIYILFLFSLSISYTDESNNINCVHLICGFKELTFENYTYFWPILVFVTMVLPTQFIQYIVYRYSQKIINP